MKNESWVGFISFTVSTDYFHPQSDYVLIVDDFQIQCTRSNRRQASVYILIEGQLCMHLFNC